MISTFMRDLFRIKSGRRPRVNFAVLAFLQRAIFFGLAVGLTQVVPTLDGVGQFFLRSVLIAGMVVLLVSIYTVTAQRFRDIGTPGGFALLTFVPYLGELIMVILIFIPGTPGKNRYGIGDRLTDGEMSLRIALRDLALRYLKLIAAHDGSDSWERDPRLSLENLLWMCREIGSEDCSFPVDKIARWLGFIQGCLAMRGLIDVDTERDFSRDLFHKAYADLGLTIPATTKRSESV